MKYLVLALVFFTLISSCRHNSQKTILSSGKMEKILYDYHLSRAIASQSCDSQVFRRYEYTESVFQKYNVRKAEFDSSLIWYSQHTDKLYDIYQNVEKRLQKEIQILGLQTSVSVSYSQLSTEGDTANIWNGKTFVCLSVKDASPILSFSIKADSSFLPFDRYLWHFHTRFIYPSGRRNAIVSLSIRYDNDSVGTICQHLLSDDDYGISLKASDRSIKQVYGFIYHQSEWSDKEKILLISDISLIRFRQPNLKDKEPDTISLPTLPLQDTIRIDSIKSNAKTRLAPTPFMKTRTASGTQRMLKPKKPRML